MDFEFINVGPMENVKINLEKDLTFVYGKNSLGKSYAITLTYLILKNFSSTYIDKFFMSLFPIHRIIGDSYLKSILEKVDNTATTVDISQNVINFILEYISFAFIKPLEESIVSSFGSVENLNNRISNKPFSILLHFKEYVLKITEKDNKLNLAINYSKKIVCKKVKRHFSPKISKKEIKIYYSDNKSIFQDDLIKFVIGFIQNSYYELKKDIGDVYFLPASRSGLYRALNAFSQILAELSKKRSFVHQKIVLPSISEQDSDYFSFINDINIKSINQDFDSIAKKIEKDLLHGSVIFNQKTKQILFRPNNSKKDLELLGASSMIAEVSPIVLFLRYIIVSDFEKKQSESKKPIIFIEEPEAHLHPENQVKLIDYFKDIIKIGAKIVITSHSNYIFSKLNNLLAEKKLLENEVAGYLLSNYSNGSRSIIIKQTRLGFEDNNFVNIAEKLYNEKLKIINKL